MDARTLLMNAAAHARERGWTGVVIEVSQYHVIRVRACANADHVAPVYTVDFGYTDMLDFEYIGHIF